MLSKKWCAIGLATLLSGTTAQAQTLATFPETSQPPAIKVLTPAVADAVTIPGTIVISAPRTPGRIIVPAQVRVVQDSPAAGAPGEPETRSQQIAVEEGQPTEAPLGPTPLTNVNILNDLVFG